MMMICKTRVKPFDVLIKNRITILTSGGTVTQLVDECQVKKEERVTHYWQKLQEQKKNCHPEKQFAATII